MTRFGFLHPLTTPKAADGGASPLTDDLDAAASLVKTALAHNIDLAVTVDVAVAEGLRVLRLLARAQCVSGVRIVGVAETADPDAAIDRVVAAWAEDPASTVSSWPHVIVDRLLAPAERLPRRWPVDGDAGHAFSAAATGVLMDAAGVAQYRSVALKQGAFAADFAPILVQCKRQMLASVHRGAVDTLTDMAGVIATQGGGAPMDAALLRAVIVEVVAAFPVYRTHFLPGQSGRLTVPSEAEHSSVEIAFDRVAKTNPDIDGRAFETVWRVLRMDPPEGLAEPEISDRNAFVRKFQCLTAAAMRTGFQNRAVYRHAPLLPCNETGGDPGHLGVTVENFHRQNRLRLEAWPAALLSTSSVDDRFGEDFRARLAVLPEITSKWARAVGRWRSHNEPIRQDLGDHQAPTMAEEYLIYQALVGAWPAGGAVPDAQLRDQIWSFIRTAMRGAGQYTTHELTEAVHEQAVERFVKTILDPRRRGSFLPEFLRFHRVVEWAGYWNGLVQALVKMTGPGVPDFMPGTELWDLTASPSATVAADSLSRAIAGLRRLVRRDDPAAVADALLKRPQDGRLKAWVTHRVLACRAQHQDLFVSGAYHPVQVDDPRGDRVLAFTRKQGERQFLIVAGRLFTRSGKGLRRPVGPEAWGDIVVPLARGMAAAKFRDVVTGHQPVSLAGGGLQLADVFRHLPLALLEVSPAGSSALD